MSLICKYYTIFIKDSTYVDFGICRPWNQNLLRYQRGTNIDSFVVVFQVLGFVIHCIQLKYK